MSNLHHTGKHKKEEYICENECRKSHCKHTECILVSLGKKEPYCDVCRMDMRYNICSNRKCIVNEEKRILERIYRKYVDREEEIMRDKFVTADNAHISISKTGRSYEDDSSKSYEYINRRTSIKFVSEEDHPYLAWTKHLETRRYIISFCYYANLLFEYVVQVDEKNFVRYKYISFTESKYTFDTAPYSDRDIHIERKARESKKHYKYRCVRNKWLNEELL